MSATQEAGEIFGAGRGPAHAMLRSPTVLIASIGLWGMNVFFYKLFGLDYVHILLHDLKKLVMQEQQQHQQQGESSNEATGTTGHASSSLVHPRTTAVVHAASSAPSSAASSRDSSPNQQLIQRQPSINNNNNNTTATMTIQEDLYHNKNNNDEEDDFLLVPKQQQQQKQQQPSSESMDTILIKSGGDQQKPVSSSITTATTSYHHHDPDAVITWDKLVGLSLGLLLLLHTTYFTWLDVWHGDTIGAVALFYTLVLAAILIPLKTNKWLLRVTGLVLHRTYELVHPRWHCLHMHLYSKQHPPRFIPFVDVFYADAMCSLSKVFFDWGMLFHMATHYPHPVPASAHNILIPSACAAIPYLIRARQCLVMYTVGRLQQSRNRFQHLWNAAKYVSSILPLIVSAYQQTIPKRAAAEWESTLIGLMVINSTFSLYWDIVMDWGMWSGNPLGVILCDTHHHARITGRRRAAHAKREDDDTDDNNNNKTTTTTIQCIHAFLRARLRFGVSMSALILGMDVVLRFSWLLRFAVQAKVLRLDSDSFVLCTQFLEVFRRALWNLLRVEWEHMKQQQQQQKQVSPKATKTAPLSLPSSIIQPQTTPPPSTGSNELAEQELAAFLPTAGKLNQL